VLFCAILEQHLIGAGWFPVGVHLLQRLRMQDRAPGNVEGTECAAAPRREARAHYWDRKVRQNSNTQRSRAKLDQNLLSL
jgi:hypothetical protein